MASERQKIEAAMKETVSRTIVAGGKKSEFKKAVAKNLFRTMGRASHSYKQAKIQEVNDLVDELWKECLETIANTAQTAKNEES